MELEAEVLNKGLSLSMEFGENWLKDINDRLNVLYPTLSKAELNTCNKLCRKINRFARNYICNNPVKDGQNISFMDSATFNKVLLSHYSWIDEENLTRLYSQSCYYALK